MEPKEARSIVAQHLAAYQSRPYAEAAAWARELHSEAAEVVGPSGTRYQIEVQFFWDDKPEGDVRVFATIDGGGISAFRPLTDSFILSPDGNLAGE